MSVEHKTTAAAFVSEAMTRLKHLRRKAGQAIRALLKRHEEHAKQPSRVCAQCGRQIQLYRTSDGTDKWLEYYCWICNLAEAMGDE